MYIFECYRGYVYARNPEPEAGWVAYGDGYLIHRPAEYDQRPAQFIHIMDPSTLKVNQTIKVFMSSFQGNLGFKFIKHGIFKFIKFYFKTVQYE